MYRYLHSAFVFFSFLISADFFSRAYAERVPSDFNNDGLSELVVVSIGKSLTWSPIDVATGKQTNAGTIGIPGDHIILGDWLGTRGSPQIGIVRVKKNSNEILWRVKNSSGDLVEDTFGEAGDTVFAAADFNLSGAADAVTLSRKGKKLIWTLAFDPLLGGTETKQFSFGSPSEKVFYTDPDGKGKRFGLFVAAKLSTKVRLLNPMTGKRKVIGKLPALAKRERQTLSTVLPVKAPDGSEVLAVISGGKNRTTVSTLNIIKKKSNKVTRAKRLKSKTLPVGGDVVAGNFLSNPGFELAIQANSGIMIWNIFDNKAQMLEAPAGVLVDEFNINKLTASSNGKDPEDTPSPDPVIPGTPTSGSLKAVCATSSPINPGELLIKSDPSDHIHLIDARTTGYTVVCARLCPRNISLTPFFYANGELAGEVASYGLFSGNGQPRMYGAVGLARQHFSNEIAAKAAKIGNGKLYLQMDPSGSSCKEFNPLGRNGSL